MSNTTDSTVSPVTNRDPLFIGSASVRPDRLERNDRGAAVEVFERKGPIARRISSARR